MVDPSPILGMNKFRFVPTVHIGTDEPSSPVGNSEPLIDGEHDAVLEAGDERGEEFVFAGDAPRVAVLVRTRTNQPV